MLALLKRGKKKVYSKQKNKKNFFVKTKKLRRLKTKQEMKDIKKK